MEKARFDPARHTILLAFYRDFVTRAVRKALESRRFHVVECAGEADIREVIENEFPGILVVDLDHPAFNAWDLILSLHENPCARHIGIIFCWPLKWQYKVDITTYLSPLYSENSAYIVYPLAPTEIIHFVNLLINRTLPPDSELP